MSEFTLWLLMIVFPAVHEARLLNDVVISRKEASSFVDREKRFWSPSVYEECTGESDGCSLHEVLEHESDRDEEWREFYRAVKKCPRSQCRIVVCYARPSCQTRTWSQWSPSSSNFGQTCYIQRRTQAFQYSIQRTRMPLNCNNILKCGSKPTQQRTWCECTKAICTIQSWSTWQGAIKSGQCGSQTRFRSYSTSTIVMKQIDSCNDIQSSCPEREKENRTFCNCVEAVCSLQTWTSWRGDLPSDGCGSQTRSRSYNKSTNVVGRKDNCEGIVSSCPTNEKENRTTCNCHYQEDCTVKKWGSWSGDIPELGCGVQIRKREYNETEVFVQAESCDSFIPCPTILEEARTMCNCRYAVCDWGEWATIKYDGDRDCTMYERYRNKTVGTKIANASNCDDLQTTCNSPDVRKEEKETCGDGETSIRTEPTSAPTKPATTEPLKFIYAVPIGCYRDRGYSPRVLPKLYWNVRGRINWKNLQDVVQECARNAADKGFEYFGIQFYGECWSGPNAKNEFYKKGLAHKSKCYKGVGRKHTNFIYKLAHLPECFEKLEFETKQSSGDVKEETWCTDTANEYQWFQADLEKAMTISGIATQGDRVNTHWVKVFNVEYSEDGKVWNRYLENNEAKHFTGNSDSHTMEITWFDHKIVARYIRLRPVAWNADNICMRVRIFGCEK